MHVLVRLVNTHEVLEKESLFSSPFLIFRSVSWFTKLARFHIASVWHTPSKHEFERAIVLTVGLTLCLKRINLSDMYMQIC